MDFNGNAVSATTSTDSKPENDADVTQNTHNYISTTHENIIPNGVNQTLLSYRKSPRPNADNDSFSKRAIESLIKKLKDRKGDLENLLLAITSGGAHETPCVCIGRTLDGRLQVAGKKGFPHVIFARIWRWPELSKNELKHLPMCRFPFDLKLDNVCINPYHYERVIAPSNPFYPNFPGNNPNFTSNSCLNMNNKQDYILKNNNSVPQPTFPVNVASTHPCSMVNQVSYNLTVDQPINNHIPPRPSFGQDNDNSINGASIPALANNQKNENNYIGTSNHISQAFSNVCPISNQNPAWCSHPPIDPVVVPSALNLNPLSNTYSSTSNLANHNQEVCDHWCVITYHEFEVCVGEPFKVPLAIKSVTIDGYFDLINQSGSRMSLGQYTNLQRTHASERTRMYVGKGIELKWENDNEIYLFCHSDCSVFVENYYLDELVGKPHGSAIHKIYPRACLKIFDIDTCYRSMKIYINSYANSHNINAPSSDQYLSMTRSLMNSLMKYCGVRLSFVKGWGPDYPRHLIQNTPCWIDIVFTKPVILMNDLLDSFHAKIDCSTAYTATNMQQG